MRVAPIREGGLERETFAFRDLFSDRLEHEPSGAHRYLLRVLRRQLGCDDIGVQERRAVGSCYEKLTSKRRLAGSVWSRKDQDLLDHVAA
jgi:hypothetical protein